MDFNMSLTSVQVTNARLVISYVSSSSVTVFVHIFPNHLPKGKGQKIKEWKITLLAQSRPAQTIDLTKIIFSLD